MTNTIAWTRPMLERFKKALKENEGSDTFTFDGNEFVVDYAKYLAEYLDGVLDRGAR